MGEDRRWMYDGWDKSGGKAHSAEWSKIQAFIDRALSLTTRREIWCPCSKHGNQVLRSRMTVVGDLVGFGFTPNYEMWTFHGEKETPVEVEGEADDDSTDVDRMDKMLDAIQSEFNVNSKYPPTKEVEEFFKLLEASEEPLHKHIKVPILAFVTRLMAIKSKYFFLNSSLLWGVLAHLTSPSFGPALSSPCPGAQDLAHRRIEVLSRVRSICIGRHTHPHPWPDNQKFEILVGHPRRPPNQPQKAKRWTLSNRKFLICH